MLHSPCDGRTCQIHEEKVKNIEELLRRRELAVKTLEDTYDQRLKNELSKYFFYFLFFFTALLHNSFASYFHNNLDNFLENMQSRTISRTFQWFIFGSLFIYCDLCQVWAGVKGGVCKENRKTDWEWEQKQRWVFWWSSSSFLLLPGCWSCWRSYCFSVETARIQKESAVIDRKLEEHSRTCSELKRLQVNNPSSVNHFNHHWVIGTAFTSYQLTLYSNKTFSLYDVILLHKGSALLPSFRLSWTRHSSRFLCWVSRRSCWEKDWRRWATIPAWRTRKRRSKGSCGFLRNSWRGPKRKSRFSKQVRPCCCSEIPPRSLCKLQFTIKFLMRE